MKPEHEFNLLRKGTGKKNAVAREQARLLARLWQLTRADASYGCVSFRKVGMRRFEDHFIGPDDICDLPDLLLDYGCKDYDQYFCPNSFNSAIRLANSVRETRLAWCDIDEADPSAFIPKPSLLWRTSPDRTQGIWIWDKRYSPNRAAQYSKALAYRHDGDNGGWSANKLLRLPGSINHKSDYNEPKVILLAANFEPISTRPKLLKREVKNLSVVGDIETLDPGCHKPRVVLKKFGAKIDPIVRVLAKHKSVRIPDRSKQVYMIIRGLHIAGATPNEIASVVWNSIYFQDKYGTSRAALDAEIGRIVAKLEASK